MATKKQRKGLVFGNKQRRKKSIINEKQTYHTIFPEHAVIDPTEGVLVKLCSVEQFEAEMEKPHSSSFTRRKHRRFK